MFGFDQGLGIPTQENVDALQQELRKALEISYTAPKDAAATPGVGAAFRVEALDKDFYDALYREEQAALLRAMPRTKARSIVESYNVILSYGEEDQSAFVGEIALPEEQDSTYKRREMYIKYLAMLGRVSMASMLIQTPDGQSPMAKEQQAKMRLMISQINRALYYGDSAMEPLEFSGLQALMTADAPTNYLDVRGPLSLDLLSDAVTKVAVRPNWGLPSDCFLAIENYNDFNKALVAAGRFPIIPAAASGGSYGVRVNTVDTPIGPVALRPDVFLGAGRGDKDGVPSSSAIGQLGKRPGTPTLTTAETSPVEATALFAAADAGAYYYKVVAVNNRGRSAPLTVGPLTIAAGDKGTFGITPDITQPLPTHFVIYRTEPGAAASTALKIMRVAANGAAEVTVNDLNTWLPGASDSFLLELNSDAMVLKELLGMVMIPLPQVELSHRWMQVEMCGLQLMKPTHQLILRNIKRAPGSVT